jgi:hypothetical protein
MDAKDNVPPTEAEQQAAQLSAEIRERSEGMTEVLREELFSQKRLVRRGREEVAPALYVDAAEGIAVFQGLNSHRDLLGSVKKAVGEIAANREAAVAAYAKRLQGADQTHAPAANTKAP